MALIQGNNARCLFIDNYALFNYLKTLKTLTPTEKLTALILALHRNSKTLQCNPSIKRIKETTCLSKQTVVNAIKKLIEKGIIGKQKVLRSDKAFTSSHYYFLFDLEDAQTMLDDSYPFQNSMEAEFFDKWNDMRIV